MTKRRLPNHLSGTHKEWRKQKRKELDAALESLNEYELGCAFTPDYLAFCGAINTLRSLRKSLREKEWSRPPKSSVEDLA